MSRLFITSSGTGIGKTFLTSALLVLDRQLKGILRASKPVISGWPADEDAIPNTDTGLLLQSQGKVVSLAEIDAISPWRLQAPLSPDLAGKLEGKILDPAELIAFADSQWVSATTRGEMHLIEGVGGVMCPLAPGFTVLDWITEIKGTCVVVVGTYLGALSHALTAILALQSRHIPIAAVVINETPNSTVTLVQTRESLSACAPSLPFFTISYLTGKTDPFTPEIKRLYAHLQSAKSAQTAIY